MPAIGKTLIILGCVFIIAGLGFLFADHIAFLGKMPGDISIENKRFSFYFPVATCLIISIILTVFFYIFRK